MTYRIVVPVEGSGGFINGVTVDAWKVTRFANTNVPAKDASPPSGSPDAGPVTTATNGAPGQAVLDVEAGYSYNIRVQQGSNAYWTQTSEPLAAGVASTALQSFQGRTATAAVLTKADVTGTGLTYSDVNADISGAAATKVAKDSLVYNVLDHGIVCDSSTDNASAINALISSMPSGSTLYFPPAPVGTTRYYGVRSPIEVTRQIVLRGDSLGTASGSSTIATRIRALSGFTGGAIIRNFATSDYKTVITHTGVSTTNGSAVINDPSASSLSTYVNALVTGTGIPTGSYIKSVNTSTGDITISQAATADGSVSVQYGDINGKAYAPNYAPSHVNALTIKDITIDLGQESGGVAVCNNTVGLQLTGIYERTEIRNVVIQNNNAPNAYGNVAVGVYNSLGGGSAIGRYIMDHVTVYGYGWLHELALDGTNGGTILGDMMLDCGVTNWTTTPGPPDGTTHQSSVFYVNAVRGAYIEGHAEAIPPNSAAATWASSTAYAKDAPIVVNGVQYWATTAGTSSGSAPAFYGTWQPSTAYTVNTIVNNLLGAASSAILFKCTVAGTSGSTPPAWSYDTTTTFTDGGVTWQPVGVWTLGTITDNTVRWTPKTTAPYAAQPWVANTYIPTDTYGNTTVTEAGYPNVVYRCTTSGTTGSSNPSWNRTLGATTTDGSVVWRCVSTDAGDCANVRLIDCPDAYVRVLFKTDQWAVATRPIVRATQTAIFSTTSTASGTNPMSSPKLDHCILSQQPGRGWIGSIVEDYMGGLTRVLSYDPTTFNPSWITYDGITCEYGNANNYSPYYSVPTVISYVSGAPVTLAGDVTGASNSNTVGKIQGVAVSAADATLVSQGDNVSTQSSLVSRTANPGEMTVVNSTSGGTLTLPTAPTQGTLNTVANNTSGSITVTSAANTLRTFGTVVTNYTLAANTLSQWRYSGSVWVLVALSPSSPLLTGNNLSELTATASTARTNLGLGTAATSASSDFLAAGSTASGDVTGTLGSSLTVGKVQGVAITSNEATLVTQTDNTFTTTNITTRTMNLGEMLVINGTGGGGVTVTFPSSPATGTINTIANNTSSTIGLSAPGITLRYLTGLGSSFTQPANSATRWEWSGAAWVLIAYSPTAYAPSGSAGGDLTGTYPSPTLAAAYAGSSPVGSATAVPVLTIDTKGRITATSTAAPSDTTRVLKAGDTMSGALAMGSNKITGLAAASANGDAVRYEQITTLKGIEIASTYYTANVSKTVTGSTLAAFDTTNLTVSFTAPASGQVWAELIGVITVGTAGTNAFWGVATHNTTTVQGSLTMATQTSTQINGRAMILITGLTPGSSYQYDWVGATGTTGSVTQTLTIRSQTTATGAGGPAIMRILTA